MDDEGVRVWVESTRALYKAAKKIARRGFVEDVRTRLRQELETKLLSIAQPYLKDETAPR